MNFNYEVKPVIYLDHFPKLPIDAPIGYPYIDLGYLDQDFHNEQTIGIADLVVTVLFKFMQRAMTAFLDLDRPNVHYIQRGGTSRLDFCIKTDRRGVIVRFTMNL